MTPTKGEATAAAFVLPLTIVAMLTNDGWLGIINGALATTCLACVLIRIWRG